MVRKIKAISRGTRAKLNKLSPNNLDMMMNLCGIGLKQIRGKPLKRETKIYILCGESEKMIKKFLKTIE